MGILFQLVYFLLIGLAAGWIAGQVMKGRSFGLVNDLIIGVIGAILGGFLFSLLGLAATGLIGSLITATVGAVVFLYILRVVKKRY
ncbi:MAG: GlsB/YeaQ/YmgE family stress response membrane protein [Isosphaeraceae bacterium]